MGKDNLTKTVDNLGKTAFSFLKRGINFLDILVAKISEFDDSDNLKTRVVSGIVMVLLGIFALCFFKGLFFLLVIAITILMTFEWLELTKTAPKADQRKWHLIGFIYILFPMFAVLKLREHDYHILLWMFAIIAATDVFAYFAGKNFGGPKLMPLVSPNKTWAGLAGGIAASVIIGFLSSFMFEGSILFFMFVSAVLSIIEQIGDLIESKFKRIFGVKDSGNIIPGHGGVLDRFDGMMLVAPTVLLLVWFCSESFASK